MEGGLFCARAGAGSKLLCPGVGEGGGSSAPEWGWQALLSQNGTGRGRAGRLFGSPGEGTGVTLVKLTVTIG